MGLLDKLFKRHKESKSVIDSSNYKGFIDEKAEKKVATVSLAIHKEQPGMSNDATLHSDPLQEEPKEGDSFRIYFDMEGSGPYHGEQSVKIYIRKYGYELVYEDISPMGGGEIKRSMLGFGFFNTASPAEIAAHINSMSAYGRLHLTAKDIRVSNKIIEFDKSKMNISSPEVLIDVTFIRDIKHIPAGPWHQYDILLAARGYGWEQMLDWADYMAQADLDHITQVTVSSLVGEKEKDITESYLKNGGKCGKTAVLKTEKGTLSIAGISKTLKVPVKIVWFNQTRVLRFFTLADDELLMTKYVETVIRRTFGTENAMKFARPIPKEQP